MSRNEKPLSFYEVVTAAVRDISEHGYDSQTRVDFWLGEIAKAAARDMTPPHVLQETLNGALRGLYQRLIDKGGILQQHPGVSRYTLEKIKPALRAELDRRIVASAQLIKLNREAAIQKTLQRFSGWATSIPIGGSEVVDKVDTKDDIKKSLKQLPFEERRVIIDQSHKLVSSLSEIVAHDGGAIAGEWHSHWKQLNYNYRRDHKERDQKVYAVRGNWAIEQGLMKVGPAGYTDEITTPGEEVFCRCYYRWLYNVRDLPDDMVTVKGKAKLAEIRGLLKS